MRRRRLIALLGGILLAWPVVSFAQQSDQVRRIGVLMGYEKSDPQAPIWIAAFVEALRKLGWIEDRNLQIEYRWVGDDLKRTRAFARELVALAPEVILVSTNPGIFALKEETRTVPIVFVVAPDPVGQGFVASLAKPGGNITGFTNLLFTISGKWLEMLKEVAPHIVNVAVIYDAQNPSWRKYWSVIEAAAPSFGVQLKAAAGSSIHRFIEAGSP